MDTVIALKAIKSARLACGELKLEHEDTAANQGRIAGQLAAQAGATTELLNREVPELQLAANALVWSCIVDGWYDAQPKAVTEDDYRDMRVNLQHNARAIELLERMWSELQRRRGL